MPISTWYSRQIAPFCVSFFSFWIISSTFVNCSMSHFFLKLSHNNFYRWCKCCIPPRVRHCNTKYLTLNLVYLIEINLHICILILTSFGPFLLLLLWLLFWNFFWLSFFPRDLLFCLGGISHFVFLIKKLMFFVYSTYFYFCFFYFHFLLRHMFFLINGFFSVFLPVSSRTFFDEISKWDFLTWKWNRLPPNSYNLL